ncbi:unnamed protein product [Closterium sp. NIES-54]
MTPSDESSSSSSYFSSSAPPCGPVAAPLSSSAPRFQALPQAARDAPMVCDSGAWEPDEADLDIVMSLDSLDPLDAFDPLDSFDAFDSLDSPLLTSPRSAVIHPVGPVDHVYPVDPVDPVDLVNAVGFVDATRTQRPMMHQDYFGRATLSVRGVHGCSTAQKLTTCRFAAERGPCWCMSIPLRGGTSRGATTNGAAKAAAAGFFEDYQRLLHAYLPVAGVSEESLSLVRAYLFLAPHTKRARLSTAVPSCNYYYPSLLERAASGKSLRSGTAYTGYSDAVRFELDFSLPATFGAISCGRPKAHLLITTANDMNTVADVVGTETTSGTAVANPNTTSTAAAANPCTHGEQQIFGLRSSGDDSRPETTQRTPQLVEVQQEGAEDGCSYSAERIKSGGNLTAIGGECGREERTRQDE